MKKYAHLFFTAIAFLVLANVNAQVNRRDTKKSVAYRANYQRMVSNSQSMCTIEIREGQIWVWGNNGFGQFGDGTTTSNNVPQQIGSNNNWVTVAQGGAFTLGIKSDGTLWAWGDNRYGQLGDGTTTQKLTPIQVGTDNKWISVSAGSFSGHGVKSDGTLWAWGWNNSGQLGDGTTTDRYTPIQIGTDNKWGTIISGSDHNLAIKSDGTLWTWGSNTNGQLGDGTTTQRNSPVQIGTDNKWVSISEGQAHSLAIKSDGTLWSWGWNNYGELGDGTVTDRLSPLQIGTDNKWVSISAGLHNSFGLKVDGTLWAWGRNDDYYLGDGTNVDRHAPVRIGTDNNWIAISGAYFYCLGLKSDGTLWAWGKNTNGEFGDGTYTSSPVPIQIGTPHNEWISISIGNYNTLGLKADGTIWAWGDNQYGQFGNGTTQGDSIPKQIGTENKWISVKAGYSHSLCLKADGTLWAWGYNNGGQLGDGTTTDKHSPIQIGTDNKWVSIYACGNYSQAIKSDGTLWAWGDNGGGVLGDGTITSRTSPIKIGTDNKWVSVICQAQHSLALKADGTLWAWGVNGSSQVGDGTTTDRKSPVQIGTTAKWVCIGIGAYHGLAIRTDGTLWSWGFNGNYEVGDGTKNPRNGPIQIGTDNDWMSLSGGESHSLGLKSNGTLWIWGNNEYGQTGDGPNKERISPTQLGTLTTWVNMNGMTWHSMGLKADRIGFCGTGENNSGQLGDGTTIDRNTFTCSSNTPLPPSCPQPPIPSATDKTICSGSNVVLSATGVATLSWYSTVNGGVYLGAGANYTTAMLTADTTFYIQDSICISKTARLAVHIKVNSLPVVIANSSANTVCKGTSVTLSGTSASLSTPINYSWSDGINNGISFIPSSSKTYTVTGTDANGCSATATKTISVNNIPIVTANASANTLCAGSSITLTGSGANTYSWTDGVSNGVSFTPSSTHTYTVTGTDANNCSNIATTNININTKPIITANASATSVCSGGSVTLTGTSTPLSVQTTYSWLDGVIDGVSFTPTATKTYTVTGTDANNCFDTDTITIYVNSLPTVSANASTTTVCSGASVVLTGTSTPLNSQMNYSWSDGVIDGVNFNPTLTKTYTVTGSDANGCIDSDTITIIINNTSGTSVTANASNTTVCSGDSIILFGQGATSYTWSDGVMDGLSFIPTATKIYTVTSSNTNNCSNTATITIHVNSSPSVIATASNSTVCEGTSTALNGQGATSYAWSDGINNGASFIPIISKTYTLTGTDANGCSDTDVIIIHVISANSLTVTANASANNICTGTSTTLSGQGASSYAWSDGVNNGVTFIPTTSKTYTVTGTDVNGCFDTDTIRVILKPAPNVFAKASHTTICEGDSIYLSSEGNALSFSWVGNMKDSLNFAPTATHTYTLTGTAQNGCSTSNTVTVVVFSLPLVGVSGLASKTLICSGDSVILAGSGADKYYWSGGIKDRKAFYPLTTSTYTLTGITNNTCDNTTSITIQVNKSPIVNPVVSPSSAAVCQGSPITLYGTSTPLSAQMNYIWSDSVSDGVPFIPLASHTYTVIGTDANNNCSGTALRAISVFLLPDVGITASPSVTICLGDSVLLKGTGANTYDWSDNIMDSVSFSPQATTTYYVTGKDQYSCADTASQLIIVDSTCNEIIGVGIIESDNNSIKINIYPNPNNGEFTITGTSDGTYDIINDLGQTIQQFKLNSTNQYSITIENLNSGIYFMVGSNNNNDPINRHKIIVIQ